MGEETSVSASVPEVLPPPDAQAPDARQALAKSVDRVVRARPGALNEGAGPDGEAVVKALDEYLLEREADARKKSQAETKPTRRDIAWLWTLVAGLFLTSTLIPSSVFEKLPSKDYAEKILTYLVGAGLLTKWIRSPQDLIEASRTRKFQLFAGALAALSALLAIPVVKVRFSAVPPETEVFVDTAKEKEPDGNFRTRLKGMQVRLFKPASGTDRARERFLSISLLDLLRHSSLSGTGLLVEQKFRMDYPMVIGWCLEEECTQPITLTFTLETDEFDDAFTRYLTQKQVAWQENPPQFSLDFQGSDQREFRLLPGKYNVRAKNCRQPLKPMEVGDRFPQSYTAEVETCAQ